MKHASGCALTFNYDELEIYLTVEFRDNNPYSVCGYQLFGVNGMIVHYIALPVNKLISI